MGRHKRDASLTVSKPMGLIAVSSHAFGVEQADSWATTCSFHASVKGPVSETPSPLSEATEAKPETITTFVAQHLSNPERCQ